MSESKDLGQICPHLGLAEDHDTRFSYPDPAHLCFAEDREASVSLGHQTAFCLTQRHPSCPRFVEPPPPAVPVAHKSLSAAPEVSLGILKRVPLWVTVVGGLCGLLAILAVFYCFNVLVSQPKTVFIPTAQVTLTPTPSPTVTTTDTPSLDESPAGSTPTPVSGAFLATPTATLTPVPGDRIYSLSPAAPDIGWVASGQDQGNHFGDSFLYAGVFEGQVYHSAFQFNLSSIPRAAPIHYAAIQMTGLRDDRLGTGGTWTLRLLATETDQGWRRHSYQDIFNAPVLQTLAPILGDQDLIEGQTNVFELSRSQIEILERRIIEDENPRVSFRIDGPLVGQDNLFAWDTGYGPKSRGDSLTLFLSVGPPPATPPSYNYVVVTSTPTPESALTSVAIVIQMTADATRIGTATPIPANVVTATPIPEYLVIVPTPTPENGATAQAMAILAAAEALTTGTPTPIPTNAMTATPLPTATPTPTYVLITATPTPDSIFKAATLSANATAQAQGLGTPTPLPANWVTPIVVTSTPTPINSATAEFAALLATAQAVTTGTPTPTPMNMVTATPTPVFVLLDGELPPMTATPIPTIVPAEIPPELIGKIAFKSDRSGQEEIYLVNPDGTDLALLSDRWPYELALAQDAYSADQRFRVFVKDAVINTGLDDGTPVQVRLPAIFYYDNFYKTEEQITHFNPSLIGVRLPTSGLLYCLLPETGPQPMRECYGLAYEPAWSPTAEQVAFVSNDSGNDEIWISNRDGSDARQLTRDTYHWWDKHPSWSPDGSKIVFWSNRTGNWQIWVMDADGNNSYSLSRTGFNDWDPVWIKYAGVSEFKSEP